MPGYLHLDPRSVPPIENLYAMADEWHVCSEGQAFHKANLHVEIGLRQPSQSAEAIRQFDLADDILKDLTKSHLLRKAEVLQAYLPTFRQRTNRTFQSCAEKLLEFVERDINDIKTDKYSDLGRAMELYTLLLLGKGHVIGRPSFARQELGYNPVEGKKYSWDVTASSDGQVVPAGDYPLQIKSRSKVHSKYHSEIIKVSAGNLLNVNRHNPQDLLDKSTCIVFPNKNPELDKKIMFSRTALIGRLLRARALPTAHAA